MPGSVSVPPRSVFIDPSGKRWKRVRLVFAAVAALAITGVVLLVPGVLAPPELDGSAPTGPEDAVAESDLPVVGEGPLVRVLRTERADQGSVVGHDPFGDEALDSLQPAEVEEVGDSPYYLEKYGYVDGVDRTISLTFDDGPDPVWTPRLLDILSREEVPATFFVTGKMSVQHQDILERLTREGHAVGNHTLNHPDLSEVPADEAEREMVVTGRILRAVTGERAGYVRLPYSSDDPEAVQDDAVGILRAQRAGYAVTSHDFDTLDWRRSSDGSEIPLPPLDGRNLTLLLHDAGGDREATLEYVERLVPLAREAGYTFHTMPQVQPTLDDAVGPLEPSVFDRAAMTAVAATYAWPGYGLQGLFLFALAAVVLLGSLNVVLATVRSIRRRHGVPAGATPVVGTSVLLAAYNEETVIGRTLDSLLASTYPFRELLVVDDGSTDGTADVVRAVARRDGRVRLVVQRNTGKSGALNRGLAEAVGDVVVTLDADTIVTPDTVGNVVRHFALDPDGRLGAVAGVVRVGNRAKNLLTRWQALEYLTQIGVERAAHDVLGAITIVPGACAAWRREAVLSVGGFSDATLAEDCDLTLTMHRHGYRCTQDDRAYAYTEAPEDVDSLLAQRTRWTYGTLQAIFLHRDMLLRPRYGWLGMFVMPWYVLSVVVPVLALPFVATMAVITVRSQGWSVLLLYFLAFMAVHVVIAAVGVVLMRESPAHLLMVPVYRLVHEPLRAFLLYTSLFLALRGVRAGWNKLSRTGTMDDVHLVDLVDLGELPLQPAASTRGLAPAGSRL